MSETIGFLLNDSARLFRRAFNARTKGSGITALQWRLITYLKRHEGIRQGPLAELLEVEPITLSRMVDRLAEAGLIERRADPTDRRAWRLYLTARGTELLDELRPFARETLEAAQARLSSGTSTTFEVLQFQRDLATAEINQIRARADHIRAIAEYARVTGLTLVRNGITIE